MSAECDVFSGVAERAQGAGAYIRQDETALYKDTAGGQSAGGAFSL